MLLVIMLHPGTSPGATPNSTSRMVPVSPPYDRAVFEASRQVLGAGGGHSHSPHRHRPNSSPDSTSGRTLLSAPYAGIAFEGAASRRLQGAGSGHGHSPHGHRPHSHRPASSPGSSDSAAPAPGAAPAGPTGGDSNKTFISFFGYIGGAVLCLNLLFRAERWYKASKVNQHVRVLPCASFAERWDALDANGSACAREAYLKIVTGTEQMATPVGATPAGNYVGLYWQYGRAFPVPAQRLQCSARGPTAGIGQGNGTDKVGKFRLTGRYELARLLLKKKYVLGTGNKKENLGQTVQLRLHCCELMAAVPGHAAELCAWGAPPGVVGFYGTWHVRTAKYNGDGEMCLWLPPKAVLIGHVITQVVTKNVTHVATDVDGDQVADRVDTQTITTVTQTQTAEWRTQLQHPFGPKAEEEEGPEA